MGLRDWWGGPPTTHHAGGFSTLLGWAFRPRNFMKNWHHCNGGSGKVVGTVEQSRPRLCLIWSMLRFCANNWASFVSLGSGDSHVPLPGNTFWHALDRKSTRLNSSHLGISYAVFCL